MSHNYIYGSFSRLSDFPLDDRYLFDTRAKLDAYLNVTGRMTTTAYEGQLVYIIDEEALCLIQKDDQGGFYPQTITSEAYDDADIRNEIDQIKAAINNGKYNVTEEREGVAYGVYTIARDHQFVVGEYNEEDPNALFIVGNGEATDRNNALTVNRDGTVTIGTDPQKEKDVATKKYVDDAVSNVTVDLSDYTTKEDLEKAVDGLVNEEKLSESLKDVAKKTDITDLKKDIVFKEDLTAVKEEFKEALDKIDGSEVSAEAFKELSDKVDVIDEDIDGVVEDMKSLDARIINLENNPVLPEDYATKGDIAEAIGKIDVLKKKIVSAINGNNVIINDIETEAEANVIYLLKDDNADGRDIYLEYTLVDDTLTCIGDTSTSLTDYYTINEIDEKLKNIDVDHTGYATEDWVKEQNYLTQSDLDDYAKTDDIPSVEGLASIDYVDEKIANIEHPTTDLSNYYTKAEVDALIAEDNNGSGDVNIPIQPSVKLDDIVTENSSNGVKSSGIYAFVKDEISKIEHPDVVVPDLDGYATEDWVKEQGYLTDLPEHTHDEYLTELPEHTHDQYLTQHQDISGKLDKSVYNEEKKEFLKAADIKDLAKKTDLTDLKSSLVSKEDLTSVKENVNNISEKVESQQKVINNFFTGNAQEAYDELSEIGTAIVELRNQVIDGNIAGALVDRVLEIEKTHYTKDEVADLLADKADVDHTHDQYTTEDEVNDLIDSKLGQVSIDSVDPSKVIFPEEIKTTYSIGKIVVSNNTPTTLISAGQSLKDFFNIFVDETSGTNTNPSLSSITATGSGNYYEVGTTLSNPTLSFVFNDGAYKYGPEPTGCEVTSISAKFNGTVKTLDDFTKSGTKYTATYPDATVTEGSCCQLTDLDVSYSDGVAPNTNLGNTMADNNIKAGNINNKTSSACIGYRPVYAGTFTSKTEITSIESLFTADHKKTGSTAHNIKNHTEFSISIPVGTLRVAFAYPAHWNTGLPKVLDTNDSNTNIMTANTQKITIKHGLEGYTVDYNIVYFDAANPTTAVNTYKVTI